MRAHLIACLLALCALTEPVHALRSLNPCKTGYVEWSRQPLSKIVEESHTIVLATAGEFVPDTSRPGFEGYYTLNSTGVVVKGRPKGPIKVYGQAPYDYPPQFYFDIEWRHKEIVANHKAHNQVSTPGGVAGTTNVDNHCPLAPSFVRGYSYLVMLGTDSRLSFEPIHASRARDDAWFALVQEMVESRGR
ncbi:MAG: hypothetical protein AAF687_06575 [Pseudomonadota bacterium]